MSKDGIMTKRAWQSVIKRIETHKTAIAKHRDALREIIDEIESIESCADDAIQSIDYAVDRLSEYL